MPKEYSPFTPGTPVPIEFFVGRDKEIRQLVSQIEKSVSQPTIERVFVTGERGIGKSSLCRFAREVAENKHGVLALHVYLGGVTSLEEMARHVFERLLQESQGHAWFDRVKAFLGNHVKEVGLFGISLRFEATEKDLAHAVRNFIPSIRNLLDRLKPDKRGCLLVLDDINGLAGTDRFANWLKSIVDEAATGNAPVPLTLVLVGLPERRRELIRRQPSLDRVFELIHIDRFNPQETRQFFEKAFARVNIRVSDNAHRVFWKYSSGFPVFMHEIGDAAYKVDEDLFIDKRDADKAVILATQVIGAKYIEPKVMAAIRSEKYRDILRMIAQNGIRSRFTRREVLAKLPEPQRKVFDNFVKRMTELGVIRKSPDRGPGAYEFTSELYALFFSLQSAAKDD